MNGAVPVAVGRPWPARCRPGGAAFVLAAFALAASVLAAASCAPQRDNPLDARRCQPRCIAGQTCVEGSCVAPDDFVVNATWEGDQRISGGSAGRQVSCDTKGRSVAVFVHEHTPSRPRHLAARLFDRSGTALTSGATGQDGDIFPFGDATARYEQPAVAATRRTHPAGEDTAAAQKHDGFVAVALRCSLRTTESCRGRASRLVLRGFGRGGDPYETTERAADTGEISAAVSPDIVALADGRFIVCWAEQKKSATGFEIAALLVDDRGRAVGGAEPVIVAKTTATELQLAVGASEQQTVMIGWWDGSELRGRIYDAKLTRAGRPLTIDAGHSGRVTGFDVAGASEELYAIWSRDGGCPGAKRYCVRVARFDDRGRSVGAPLRLAASEQRLAAPALAIRDDDRALAVWESSADGDRDGGIAGRFLASGKPDDGGPLRVNTTTAGRQHQPAVAPCGGRFTAVYTDRSRTSPDRSGTAVRGRLLFPKL